MGPRGRPTGTLAPREGAREAGSDTPEARSAVWPPPPPPHPSGLATTTPPTLSSGDSSTAPPPQDPAAASEQPPLRSPIGDRILRCFAHLVKLSPPWVVDRGLGIFLTGLEGHGGREWGRWWSGEEAEEATRWEPADISRRSYDAQERRGWGGLGLNPNAAPLIPRARGRRTRPG
jgi:hypothetical protein